MDDLDSVSRCPSCGRWNYTREPCSECAWRAARIQRRLEVLLLVACAVGLAAFLAPNFIKARSRGSLTACKSNLKNLGAALELYSADHGGRYPRALHALTPRYLKEIPRCPIVQSDTYSWSYRSHRVPDRYSFCCGGTNHREAGITACDYPQYNSTQGLIERP
ncbi:MAG: hypothetical protein AB1758_00820 [Candidatus Eremiobacterota bacterium]